MNTLHSVTELKAYSTKELAVIYGISDKTFKKWLLPFVNSIGNKHGRYYTVAQVKIIFEKLGVPGTIVED
jgi:hypothetical protein